MNLLYVFGIFVLLFSGCTTAVYEEELESYFSHGNFQIENQVILDEFGGFGEGLAVEVYKISGKDLKTYVLHNSFEKKREGYKKINWEKFSISDKNENVIDLALAYYTKNEKIIAEINSVKSMIDNENVFMQYYFKSDAKNPNEVILYILNVSESKIYIFESKV